ncbi:MAG: hypothetical protein Q9223_007067, partial [Gallowayella weberi]
MDPLLAEIADFVARLATGLLRMPFERHAVISQSSLPQACPICLHEPVKAEDCRPNKTLRMTIKAFLKKIAAEREKAQKKQAVDKAAATPTLTANENGERLASTSPNTTSAAQPSQSTDVGQTSREAPATSVLGHQLKPSGVAGELPTEAQKDVPQPSIEATEDRVREESFTEQARGEVAAATQVTQQQDSSQQLHNQQIMQMQGMNGGNMGFEGMNNGFPNMAFNNPGDFNSMMQFMPNGVMGAFPNMMGMPGMPGMGMDPMQGLSQGMFGGLGGQSMGMNGMNEGMGFPAGQGWNNGGFNGQPGAWMSGQDKFNQNAYGGHANGMGGDFGANAGYAGYNMPSHQGNFNQMNHHQFPNHDFQSGYHGQGFHNRGRGRGRGYGNAPRGRGGYNQVIPGNHTNHEPFHHQYPPHLDHGENSFSQYSQHAQSTGREGDTGDPDVDDFGRTRRPNEEATDEQIAREMAPGDAEESPEAPAAAAATAAATEDPAPRDEKDERPADGMDDLAPTTSDPAQSNPPSAQESKDQGQEEQPAPIQTFISDEVPEAEPVAPSSAIAVNTMMPPPSPAISQPPFSTTSSDAPYEYGSGGRGADRRLSRGSSDYRGIGRGRGAIHVPNGNSNHVAHPSLPLVAPPSAPIEPKGVGVQGAPKGPKAMREGLPNTGIRGGRGFSIVGRASVAAHSRTNGSVRSRSRSPTHSRSPSHHRSHHHRSNRHRSQSASASSDREERRRERRRRRERKHEEEDEEMQDEPKNLTTRRSSHRSRRRDRDRDEDGDGDDHNSKDHHRSRRSHRERDRDREGESRSTRKRSRTPTTAVLEEKDSIETAPHSSSSSRKRRERHDEEDEARRERKRSRREHHDPMEKSSKPHETESSHRHSSTSKQPPSGPRSHKPSHHPSLQSLPPQQQQPQPPPPKTPTDEPDPHELERQARNKERLQKELQRREAME